MIEALRMDVDRIHLFCSAHKKYHQENCCNYSKSLLLGRYFAVIPRPKKLYGDNHDLLDNKLPLFARGKIGLT